DPIWNGQLAKINLVVCNTSTPYKLANAYTANLNRTTGDFAFGINRGTVSAVAVLNRGPAYDQRAVGLFGDVFADSLIEFMNITPSANDIDILPFMPEDWWNRGDTAAGGSDPWTSRALSLATFEHAYPAHPDVIPVDFDVASKNVIH